MGEFPIDRAQLLAYSHHYYNPAGPVDSIARSLVAAQNVMIRDPSNELANYFAARSALWLLEFGGADIDRDTLADKGYQWAENLIKMNPNNGEYEFLAGAHLGYKIQNSISPSLIRLRVVHGHFQRATELEPGLDDGAPLRALGTLLVKSPPWPTGVGDIDEGIAFLEQAVKMYPNHPANHLYLALAYIEDKRFQDAQQVLDKALDLVKPACHGVCADHWRNEIKRAKKIVKKELKK